MNLLLVNWMDMANPQAGGAEVQLFEIFSRFIERGDRATLVCSGFREGAPKDEYKGIRILRTGNRESFNFVAPSPIRRLISEERFDLVVEDINKVPLFTPLYVNLPVLAIIPHLFGNTVFRETNPVLASYVWLMERPIPLVYRHATFEVVSASTAKDISRRGIDPTHIAIVHNGLDHTIYAPDPVVAKFDQPTMLYVGRIKRYKSVDVAIRALPLVMECIPDVRLVVVGSGDDLERLRAFARNAGVADRVKFTGFVTEAEKVDWMRRSHVMVNPSPKEGWGLTNIEANACGTVAVASDADGLRDSVKDKETGMLFPYGDHKTLAEHVVRLFKNPDIRKQYEENAIVWAKSFTWDRCAEETMKLVKRIIS